MPAGPLGDTAGVPPGPQVSDALHPAGGYQCLEVSEPMAGVVEVCLNRTAAMNAMSSIFVREMHQICDVLQYPQSIGTDVAPRVLIIRGEGRAFCAGFDMRDSNMLRADMPFLQHAFSSVVRKLRDLPQPVIAGLNGSAVGAGMALALAADVRIATNQCRFLPSMLKLGIGGGECGTSWFLPRVIGPQRAALMLLAGEEIDAATALEWGLVARIVDADGLADHCRQLATAMLRASPKGLRLTKQLLNDSLQTPLAPHLAREDLVQVYTSADKESQAVGRQHLQQFQRQAKL